MWAVVLLIALILYPGTLTYYGVLLLFIIFQFFDEKKQLGFSMYLTVPIVAVFFTLSMYSLFAGIIYLLAIIVSKSFNLFKNVKVIPNNF